MIVKLPTSNFNGTMAHQNKSIPRVPVRACALPLLLLVISCNMSTRIPTYDSSVIEIESFNSSRKYIKFGITVVYLTGTPYEIGFAHGALCRQEILSVNSPFWEAYQGASRDDQMRWMTLAERLEMQIPDEYRQEMRGLSHGSRIAYEKILLLTALSTIGEAKQCFAFAFKDDQSRIRTLRQVDINIRSPLYKNMILFIVKPEKGHGFAAILNPGWIDGESGINERGVTVSQNNIGIRQTRWDVMPITILSRQMLQYAGSIDEAQKILDRQAAYPARLLFVSGKSSAAIFEIANGDQARIDMKNGVLPLANHACVIPSKRLRKTSLRRIDHTERFLDRHDNDMDMDRALELVRSSEITWRWTFGIQNRQSFIFAPAELNFWIAMAPESRREPASHSPYVGFNLLHELYDTGGAPDPVYYPAK